VLLHIAHDAEHKPIDVTQAAWSGPMASLTEEYKIPAVRPGLPAGEPDLALG
jgi:GntR family transcriptional regulator